MVFGQALTKATSNLVRFRGLQRNFYGLFVSVANAKMPKRSDLGKSCLFVLEEELIMMPMEVSVESNMMPRGFYGRVGLEFCKYLREFRMDLDQVLLSDAERSGV